MAGVIWNVYLSSVINHKEEQEQEQRPEEEEIEAAVKGGEEEAVEVPPPDGRGGWLGRWLPGAGAAAAWPCSISIRFF